MYVLKPQDISLSSIVYFLGQNCRGSPKRPRDVISACVADGVPFSFVFCRDSCTPPGLDGPGMIPRGPDNERKKKRKPEEET